MAGQSNATARQFSRLVSDFPGDVRQTLQADLDALAQQAGDESAAATLAAGSPPAASAAGELAGAFRDRALAVEEVRAAIDGYLGMNPLPPAAPSSDAAPPARTAALSVTDTTDRITAAGALLASSDRLYTQAPRRSPPAPGTPGCRSRGGSSTRLSGSPASWPRRSTSWRRRPPWPRRTTSSCGRSASTHPCCPPHRGQGRARRSSHPPRRLGVTAVVANQGSVAEPHAVVRLTLAEATASSRLDADLVGAGAPRRLRRPADLGLRRQARYLLRPHGGGDVPDRTGRPGRWHVPGDPARRARHLICGPGRHVSTAGTCGHRIGSHPEQERASRRGREHHDYGQPQR